MTIEEFKRMLVLVISQGLPGGYFQSIFSGEESDELLGKVKSGDVGVKAFNGRSGQVVPQKGDYTAEMVGAAPAGFGYGDVLRCFNFANNDTSAFVAKLEDYFSKMQNDFSMQLSCYDSSAPYTITLAGCNLSRSDEKNGVLSGVDSRGTRFQRVRTSSGWGQWEYENPPMIAGVEYRTTERYDGKPVFAFYNSYGVMQGTYFSVSLDDPNGINLGIYKPIRHSFTKNRETLPQPTVDIIVDTSSIVVTSTESVTATISGTIWYVKE